MSCGVLPPGLVQYCSQHSCVIAVSTLLIFSVNNTDESYCDLLVDCGATIHILNDDSKFFCFHKKN